MLMWPMPLGEELRPFKPCLKAYAISLSTNPFGRQFHWDMVLGNNEYWYLFVLWSLYDIYVHVYF